jgi:hypothetical protein
MDGGRRNATEVSKPAGLEAIKFDYVSNRVLILIS